ncbi:hypothetical protein GlitD10_2192 [Gloeomargarita lithophora Alchichica-D10]|uniref:G domain-containing protein n=1 Tax=Gloeomargarita lithophora Alchichica-D10 TaxID=1188229 RepID=A0A1J0AF12_9CYAN|nr:GTPase [Gloeomargarita lithophora]APB34521.1 hypothetical protein GlitD10_2192 [Gloeomargarita lithophora Alchichica-D10]
MEDAAFWQSIQVQCHAHAQRYQPWLGDLVAPEPPFAIVILGAPGVGKSTLLRQIVHPLPLPAGSTPWPVSIFTQEPPVLWTDTPGWSSDQVPTIHTALAQADVGFWVVNQPDSSPPELVATLKNWGRPVVKVVNLRGGETPPSTPAQGNIIAVLSVRLMPYNQPRRQEWPDGRVEWDTVILPADITALQTLWHQLLTHQQAIRNVNQLLGMAVQERQWAEKQGQTPVFPAPVLVKSLLLTLSPGGLVSVLLSVGTDLVTLICLSRRLHLPITRQGIGRVATALVLSSATVGFLGLGEGAEMGMMALGQGVWGGITSYGLQRIARTYLQQGITWQADGPDQLLQHIYARLTPGSWLHAWVGSGLNIDSKQS